MSLLTRLKEETKPEHEATETLMFGPKLMAGTLQEPEFLALLYVNLGFHDALERAIYQHTNFFIDYNLPARRKVTLIEADLNAMGEKVPTDRPDYFADWGVYQLLGAAYVAEGSTLGSRLISNVLKTNVSLPMAARQSIFYLGYGDMTGPRWTAFREFLVNRADGQDDAVVEGASAAFRLFQQLFTNASHVLHQTEL